MAKTILIAAMDVNGAIGSGNTLPWHCPQDLRHFRDLTMGKIVLMGRNTADSLKKPLRNRVNVVLSRTGYARDGFTTVTNIQAAHDLCAALGQDELWVIGGGAVYQQTIKDADVVHLTALNIEVPNPDTWFPTMDLVDFKAAVVKTCTDPNVHFWTFSRVPFQSTRCAAGSKTEQ